jgi:hypothetical protein
MDTVKVLSLHRVISSAHTVAELVIGIVNLEAAGH